MTEPTEQSKRRAPSAAVVIGVGAAILVSLLVLVTRRPAAEPEPAPVVAANRPAAAPPKLQQPPPDPPANTPGKRVGNTPAEHVSGNQPAATTPAPSSAELPPDHPEVPQVDEGSQVTLQWLGHSCFYIHSPGGAAVVTDPFDPKSTGLEAPGTGAHLVTVSSPEPQHSFTSGVRAFQGEKKEVVRGREARLKDLRVVPIETSPGRFAYVYEAAGLRIAHLGDLEKPVTADQAKQIGAVDILLVPAGGRGITPKQAVEITKQIGPRIVVPMAYSTQSMQGPDSKLRPVDDFIAASPYAVTNKDLDTILIGKSQLPASTEIYTLQFRR